MKTLLLFPYCALLVSLKCLLILLIVSYGGLLLPDLSFLQNRTRFVYNESGVSRVNSGIPRSSGWSPLAVQALLVKEHDKWLSHLVWAYSFSALLPD